MEATSFRPVTGAGEKRAYQLLAIRVNAGDRPKLAVVLSVFRGALFRKRNAKKSSTVCKIVADPLECEYCSKLHCCLLTPADEQPKDGTRTIFEASCCNPILILDPISSQGTVLGEINPDRASFEESRLRLRVAVEADAVKAVCELRSKVPPLETKKKDVAYWSAEHFPQNALGRKNIMAYSEELRLWHFHATGRPLELPEKWEWEALKQVVAPFMERQYTACSPSCAKDSTPLSFQCFVFHRFQNLVPLPGKQSKIPQFFREMSQAMPAPLQSCPIVALAR
ncbi:unnamed protein product [Symbiodinium sp. CCMP2592]|nr:unnamed protein product [Symbiodinium sp. CCMP2592]